MTRAGQNYLLEPITRTNHWNQLLEQITRTNGRVSKVMNVALVLLLLRSSEHLNQVILAKDRETEQRRAVKVIGVKPGVSPIKN